MVAVNVAADRCHLHVITDWHFTSSSLLFFTTCLYKNRKKLTTSRRHHILPIIPYSNCIWQYAVRWLLALCSQFHCHRANAWFHIHPPPPCKANVASLPCRSHAVLLSSCSLLRRRRDLLSDLQTGSERGHTFTNSTISAQFRDHIDFPCNHSPAHKLRGDWAASAGGAVTADSAPFWLAKSPSLSLVHPRLVRLVPPCTACKWSGNGDAPPRHDNTQQSSAELNQGCLRACQRQPSKPKNGSALKTTWLQPMPLLTWLASVYLFPERLQRSVLYCQQ